MSDTKEHLESWKNSTRGMVFLNRLDHRGEMTRVEGIDGGKTFHLSPEERRINSEQSAGPELDVFRNGTLTPVRLIEDSEEARELASNPNVMSESDMAVLVKIHPKTFEAKLKDIRNPVTLERLLAIAHREDASIKRVEAIKARLTEVAPSLANVHQTVSSGVERVGYGRAVSPR